jgi:hypothetical protein
VVILLSWLSQYKLSFHYSRDCICLHLMYCYLLLSFVNRKYMFGNFFQLYLRLNLTLMYLKSSGIITCPYHYSTS